MECMVFKARIGNVISIQFKNEGNLYESIKLLLNGFGRRKCSDHHLENELSNM